MAAGLLRQLVELSFPPWLTDTTESLSSLLRIGIWPLLTGPWTSGVRGLWQPQTFELRIKQWGRALRAFHSVFLIEPCLPLLNIFPFSLFPPFPPTFLLIVICTSSLSFPLFHYCLSINPHWSLSFLSPLALFLSSATSPLSYFLQYLGVSSYFHQFPQVLSSLTLFPPPLPLAFFYNISTHHLTAI